LPTAYLRVFVGETPKPVPLRLRLRRGRADNQSILMLTLEGYTLYVTPWYHRLIAACGLVIAACLQRNGKQPATKQPAARQFGQQHTAHKFFGPSIFRPSIFRPSIFRGQC